MGKKSNSRSEAPAYSSTPLFNKDLGQHILKNPLVVKSIVDKADLRPSDTVLEVGPGTGNLSIRIVEQVKSLVAIEKDPRLAAELCKRLQGTPYQRRLTVVVDDFLRTELPYFDVVISNTPYQISSPLIFRLLTHRPLWRCAVLMFQREFALRLIARPGDEFYSRLAVNVQLLARVDHVMKIGRNNFRPPPQVDSSVVIITPKNPAPTVAFSEWDGMVRVAFVRKNKTLSANFTTDSVLKMLEANYRTLCSMANLPVAADFSAKPLVLSTLEETKLVGVRASKMDVDDFLRLLAAFHSKNLHFS